MGVDGGWSPAHNPEFVPVQYRGPGEPSKFGVVSVSVCELGALGSESGAGTLGVLGPSKVPRVRKVSNVQCCNVAGERGGG